MNDFGVGLERIEQFGPRSEIFLMRFVGEDKKRVDLRFTLLKSFSTGICSTSGSATYH